MPMFQTESQPAFQKLLLLRSPAFLQPSHWTCRSGTSLATHVNTCSSSGYSVSDTSDSLNEQANEARGPEGLAAVSGRSETDKSALMERLRNEAAKSLAAKQRRRSLLADVAACTSASRS